MFNYDDFMGKSRPETDDEDMYDFDNDYDYGYEDNYDDSDRYYL